MCGINGVIRPQVPGEAKKWVMQMNASMAHRGPDAEGLWCDERVVFGHRRLSIIDTSEAGNQPFLSQDKNLVVVFNGEIYNYIELRRELEAEMPFFTDTDTEVLLVAYRKWGIEMVHRLTGMFAFALYDIPQQRVYMVRDRLGVKPLYYFNGTGGFIFASELRSLLSTDQIPRQVCPNGLAQYLQYQTVHAPATIIKDVAMLLPGHLLTFDSAGMRETCYWNASAPPAVQSINRDRKEVLNEVKARLSRAVEIRMRADVPFGAFLSGGIDSSAIVGLMSGLTSQQVKTFSITFDEKQWDESTYSQLVAKKFGTDHHEIRLKAIDFMHAVPQALEAMDHPSGDGPNTYVVSRVTREAGVKMALSGIGGDELFAGYDVFKRLYSMQQRAWMGAIPRVLREWVGKGAHRAKPSVTTEKLAAILATEKMHWHQVYPHMRSICSLAQVQRFMAIGVQDQQPLQPILQAIEATNFPLLSKISLAESNTYLQNVLLRDADQMSMAHALEVREPFLDHHLVEYVLAIDDASKYPHYAKQLMVEALGDLLPHEVVHRPKMGFTFPWANWMRNELKPFCEEGLQALMKHPLIHSSEVERAWQRFQQGDKRTTWSRIWPLVVLGQWLRHNKIDA